MTFFDMPSGAKEAEAAIAFYIEEWKAAAQNEDCEFPESLDFDMNGPWTLWFEDDHWEAAPCEINLDTLGEGFTNSLTYGDESDPIIRLDRVDATPREIVDWLLSQPR